MVATLSASKDTGDHIMADEVKNLDTPVVETDETQEAPEPTAKKKCPCQESDSNCCLDSLQPITLQSRRQLRSLAFHYIYVVESHNYDIALGDVVQLFAADYKISVDGSDFPVRLAEGVIENRERYAKIIEPLLENWRFDRIGCCTRIILCMAIWEFEQDGAVASIVINEAVELAKAFAEKDAYRFVNGLLDKIKQYYPESLKQESQNDDAEKGAQ